MSRSRKRPVAVLYGTRPEAVKIAPVIKALQASETLRPVIVTSGQHREMLDQVNELFGIVPDHDLDIFRHGQGLEAMTAAAVSGYSAFLATHPVDAVIVQGDTTSAFAGALAAYYRQTPVVHVEAGLRTGDLYSPFPEEGNRKLVGVLAAVHCAPTSTAARNLYAEGVPRERVTVTGNTVIDALLHTATLRRATGDRLVDAAISSGRRIVVVTAHRRESWGAGLGEIGAAVARIAVSQPDVLVVVPLHRNPLVREVLVPVLRELPNVRMIEPLGYAPFCHLLAHATVVVTDSGGIQEEAPALDVPVVVTRETTERPEAVAAGAAVLVGTDQDKIVRTVRALLTDESRHAAMASAPNPFGDGRAAARIIAAVEASTRQGAESGVTPLDLVRAS
ncbi:non-hydrolyzing UDP-N-acetylglucosamine 2-epimerase [Oerskovia enterophila]